MSTQENVAALKEQLRADYGIGWNPEQVPQNADLFQKLTGLPSHDGMCCLRLSEESNSVYVAPAHETATSMNLEYLAIALQVRLREGKEPFFSLDPTEGSASSSMQEKKFDPEWLAGTSVGDVLFQADYHLKELSMGEAEQPIIGMKSCLDSSNQDWSAREWFVVKTAEVQLSADGRLVPKVRMGVEAREQIQGDNGLEDVQLSRPDHPAAQYAAAFTRYFDLIAERRSVIFHLREMAKASVLAKFLVEAGVNLEEGWLNLAEEADIACSLEIPQLWHERNHSEIQLKDGEIVGAGGSFGGTVHGMYGGVEFGLDRMRVGATRRVERVDTEKSKGDITTNAVLRTVLNISQYVQRQPEQRGMAPTATTTRGLVMQTTGGGRRERDAGQALVPAAAGVRAAVRTSEMGTLGQPAPPGIRPTVATRGQPVGKTWEPWMPGAESGMVYMEPWKLPPLQVEELKGVDLNLDAFDLSAPARAAPSRGDAKPIDAVSCGGKAFWSSLGSGDSDSALTGEARSLLQDVFNPHVSDRREEGDRFVPPDTSAEYLQRLQELVKEEASMRQTRAAQFFSADFAAGSPGPLFPSSWASSCEITRGGAAPAGTDGGAAGDRLLHSHTDFRADAARLEQLLKTSIPVFNKSTEDGMSFRIYRVGDFEVRTTQEHDREEVIGAVLSRRPPAQVSGTGAGAAAREHERIVKATQYVERAPGSAPRGAPPKPLSKAPAADFRFYVVLETEAGAAIVTEMSESAATWAENPRGLEARNSLARVTRSVQACDAGATVKDVKSYHRSAAHCGSKRYAEGACNLVVQPARRLK